MDYMWYLEKERLAKDENTFLYRFYEKQIFDLALYKIFIFNINLFKNDFSNNSSNKKYIRSRKKLVDIFFYTISSFYFHYDKSDLFVIKNFNELSPSIIDDLEIYLMIY